MLDINNYKIILASASPRRKELLAGLDIPFSVKKIDFDESIPEKLENEKVAEYLAIKKSDAFIPLLREGEIVITSDTTVLVGDLLLNKPKDESEAKGMLNSLSGKMHQVITGVCIRSNQKKVNFNSISKVYFKDLEEEEINYYVTHYRPYDKAGSYGIQEWLGYIAIEKIEGSYFNIMGLPVHKIYEELQKF